MGLTYDTLGPITAYRGWGLRRGPLRLESISTAARWFPEMPPAVHGPFVSSHSFGPQHEAPQPECQCGYWAFKTHEEMFSNLLGPYVYGEVKLWGRVIEHKHGYRAQHAKVTKLYVTDRSIDLAELQSYYGAEIEPVENDKLTAYLQVAEAMRTKYSGSVTFPLKGVQTIYAPSGTTLTYDVTTTGSTSGDMVTFNNTNDTNQFPSMLTLYWSYSNTPKRRWYRRKEKR